MTRIEGKSRSLALGLTLVVAATFVIVSMVELANSRSEVATWTDDEASLVVEDVAEAIDAVLADLESVAAFIEIGQPTAESFNRFVDQIEGTKHTVGIGYTPIVTAERLDEFIAEQRLLHGEEYDLFGLTTEGSPEPVPKGQARAVQDRTSRDRSLVFTLLAFQQASRRQVVRLIMTAPGTGVSVRPS